MGVEPIIAIDTNIFISVINKEPGHEKSKKILDWIDEGKIRALVSTIVLAEMCSGYLGEVSDDRDDFLAHILGSSNYEIVNVTVPVALDAGSFRSKYKVKLPDALIFSSGLHSGSKWVVSNDDSMRKINIQEIKVISAAEFARFFADERKLK